MSSSKQGNQGDAQRPSGGRRDPAATELPVPVRGAGGNAASSGGPTKAAGSEATKARRARKPGERRDGSKPPRKPRKRSSGPNPVVAGVKSTAAAAMRGIRRAAPPVAIAIVAVARFIVGIVLRSAALIEKVLRPVHRAVSPMTSAIVRPVALGASKLEQAVTPRRALAGTTLIAAGCLIASQFFDASGVAIGGDQYISVAALSSPPLKGVETGFGPHGPLVLILGIVALVLIVASLIRSDAKPAFGASVVGLASVAVALIVDLPAASDIGDLATQFEGTDSVLLRGFYAQLAAGSILAMTGALLAVRTPAPVRKRQRGDQGSRKESAATAATEPTASSNAHGSKPKATPGPTGRVKEVGT